jgi:hypothetical protein
MRERCRSIANRVEATAQSIGKGFRLRLAANQPAKHANHLKNFLDRPLIEGDDGDAAPHEFGGQVGLQVGKGEHQVGM